MLIRKAAPALPLEPEDAILAVADRMRGKIRDAFLAAVEAVKSRVTLGQVADAIRVNDYAKVVALLDIESRFTQALGGVGIAAGTQSVREALQATYGAGARAAYVTLPERVGVRLSFDLLNPESVEFLRGYTFDLIQQVSQETTDAIRQIVIRAFEQGGHPLEQAREIREVIGLTGRMEQAVANFRAGLESGATSDLRDILDRALRDGRFDRTILNAIENQKPLAKEQVDRMVTRYRERVLKQRAENIARTESLRAANQGQIALWRQAVQQGLLPATVKRRWIVSGDERTCSRCLDLEDQQAGLDQVFDEGGEEVMAPPLHPSCRCTTALVSSSMKTRAAA